jgi:hypothetical protein
MKYTGSIVVAVTILGLGSPSSAAAQEFEGVITTRQVTLGDRALSMLLEPDDLEAEQIDHRAVFALPMDRIFEFAVQSDSDISIDSLIYAMKGTQLRVSGDFGDEMPGYAILDFGEGTFRLVQPAEKMYLELTREDFETYKAMMPEPEPEPATLSPKARPTGETKVINGMQCSAYEIESEASITLAWVTPELEDLVGAFVEFESKMKEMGMFDEEGDSEIFSVVAEHGFPVMEQTFMTFGSYAVEYEVMEILNVERKPLPAELFTVPFDFQKLSIMEMLRMMGGEN